MFLEKLGSPKQAKFGFDHYTLKPMQLTPLDPHFAELTALRTRFVSTIKTVLVALLGTTKTIIK